MRVFAKVAAFFVFLAPPVAAESSVLSGIDSSKPAESFALDATLAEISGLAVAGPNSVFAHNDEHAIVHELDVTSGAIIRSFALGQPTVAGDFEAIAVWNSFIYLVTSEGMLYEAPQKKHRERTRYSVYDTGLKSVCEIEGMTVDPAAGVFLFSCKSAKSDKENRRLTLYRWSFADRFQDRRPWLEIPLADIIPEKARRKNFKAAELQRDPATGHLLILDSQAGAVVEITAQGAPVAYRQLAPRIHPQAEGLAIMPDGSIVVGDEARSAPARLSVYGPRP